MNTNEYGELEKRMVRCIKNGYLDLRYFGNDVTFFGRALPDARLQVAFSIGWYLEKSEYEGKTYYELRPPKTFECSLNEWAGIWKDLEIDGIKISVPNWYFHDDVLLEGTHKS